MKTAKQTKAARQSDGRRELTLLLLIPCVAVGGIGLRVFLHNQQAQAEVARRTQMLVDSGLPYDDETLELYYQEGAGDDRADQWAAFQEAITSPGFLQTVVDVPFLDSSAEEAPALGETWSNQASAQAFVDQHQSILEQLIELASYDDPVHFPVKFRGLATEFPHLEAMRTGGRLLAVEANLARHTGAVEREYRAINALFGCALALRAETTSLGHLAALGLYAKATNELRTSIAENTLGEEHLRQLSGRMRLFDDFRTPAYRAMQGEIALALSAFDNPSRVDPEYSAPNSLLGFGAQDKLTYMELMEPASNLLSKEDLTLAELAKGGEDVEAVIEDWFDNTSVLEKLESLRTTSIVPALGHYMSIVVRHVADHRLSKLSLGLRLYEAKYGELPASLDLLDEFGIDAATEVLPNGEQFGYRAYFPEGEVKGIVWGYDLTRGVGADVNSQRVDTQPPSKGSRESHSYKGWFCELR